jgi:hypothetical protein
MEDFKWQPAASPVAHGQIVPIGDINIFIGYVGASTEADSQSVAGSNNMEIIGDKLSYDTEGGAKSIHPLLNGEGYYDSDNDFDNNSISSGFTDPIGVYMAGGPRAIPNPLLTPITPYNVAARAAELEEARAALIETQAALQEKERLTAASQRALKSRVREFESIA